MVYRTKGTCSQAINVEAENGIVTKVQFVGGCAGNTAGIAKLVVGMKVDDVINRLEGTTCGPRRPHVRISWQSSEAAES